MIVLVILVVHLIALREIVIEVNTHHDGSGVIHVVVANDSHNVDDLGIVMVLLVTMNIIL